MTESTADLHALAERYLLPVYRQRPIVLERGLGSRVWDRDGREYVDFAGGIAVSALGHGHPALLAALVDQAGKLWHTSNVFLSEPPLRLAQALVDASRFARRVFFCNSGAEANEAAIKLVRRWAAMRGRGPERRTLLSFHGSFHGRTLATVTATAQPRYHEGFEPLPAGFAYSPFNDLDAAGRAMADGTVCAVLVEPVQGEGGVTPATPAFLQGLRALCDRHDALLVCDEIQCGMGRTGHLFASDGYGVEPDVVTLAKALGCGFPTGAMLVGARAADALGVGSHGSTFGGNPLATAVAAVALRELSTPGLMANVVRQAGAIRDGIAAIDAELALFDEVRGAGLMIGAQLRGAYAGRAGDIVDACIGNGLMLLQAGPDVIRFVPALNIGDDDIAEGLRRLRGALGTLFPGP
ncbi:aspartate aminotransferase family protein [Lysobacter sp. A3-1-A15]|uniref:aspartate aminotransferase family protein n=1 Tax=Novilysobacter viscosus TaxID=3098602 RepID=UPI002ED9618A